SAESAVQQIKSVRVPLGVAVFFIILGVSFIGLSRTVHHSTEKEKIVVEMPPAQKRPNLPSDGASPIPSPSPKSTSSVPAAAGSVTPAVNRGSTSSDHSSEHLPTPTPVPDQPTRPKAFVFSTLLISFLAFIYLSLVMLFILHREGGSLKSFFGRSLLEQLDEIERLSKAGIIPEKELRAFKDALLQQARRRYKIPPQEEATKAGPTTSKGPSEPKPEI
ncbi:MAG: hypothetical protein QOE81_888, partial [Verrucomicrobiota bacterium]